jgi:hypothetical protein
MYSFCLSSPLLALKRIVLIDTELEKAKAMADGMALLVKKQCARPESSSVGTAHKNEPEGTTTTTWGNWFSPIKAVSKALGWENEVCEDSTRPNIEAPKPEHIENEGRDRTGVVRSHSVIAYQRKYQQHQWYKAEVKYAPEQNQEIETAYRHYERSQSKTMNIVSFQNGAYTIDFDTPVMTEHNATTQSTQPVRREESPCDDLPMIGGWGLKSFEAEIREWMKSETRKVPAKDLPAFGPEVIKENHLAWFEFEHIVNHVRKELTEQWSLNTYFGEVFDEDIDCKSKSFRVTIYGSKDEHSRQVQSSVEKYMCLAYFYFKQDALKYPSYWASRSDLSREYDEAAITAEGATADEYKKIVADFTKGFECEILEIKRIQHYGLWREYAQTKLNICRANEQYQWYRADVKYTPEENERMEEAYHRYKISKLKTALENGDDIIDFDTMTEHNVMTRSKQPIRREEHPNEIEFLKHGTKDIDPLEVYGYTEKGKAVGLCPRFAAGYFTDDAKKFYGPGTYFTDDTNYVARGYAHKVNDNGNEYTKEMLLCRVIAGRVEEREEHDRSIKRTKENYHSIRGPCERRKDGTSVHTLVVYEYHMSYPEYKIRFKHQKEKMNSNETGE